MHHQTYIGDGGRGIDSGSPTGAGVVVEASSASSVDRLRWAVVLRRSQLRPNEDMNDRGELGEGDEEAMRIGVE